MVCGDRCADRYAIYSADIGLPYTWISVIKTEPIFYTAPNFQNNNIPPAPTTTEFVDNNSNALDLDILLWLAINILFFVYLRMKTAKPQTGKKTAK